MVEQLARALDEERDAQMPLAMAFEWPRRADGWKVQALQPVLQGLNVRCEFDGCRYDLKTDAQILVKKPWR
eukprot:7005212-Heterocapsa_arctica.AAC.1